MGEKGKGVCVQRIQACVCAVEDQISVRVSTLRVGRREEQRAPIKAVTKEKEERDPSLFDS